MSEPINSDAVNHGLNRDKGKYKDDRYLRCWNCGFICHLDRDSHSSVGSQAGDGISHPDVADYDESTVTYNGEDDNWDGTVSYDGYRNDFEITGGCPLCGCLRWQSAP